MNASEIVSLRTALRYLRRGDDRAKRQRLACILTCILTGPSVMLATLVLIVFVTIR